MLQTAACPEQVCHSVWDVTASTPNNFYKATLTARLFSAPLMTVTRKFRLLIGRLRLSANRQSEFCSHSHELRTDVTASTPNNFYKAAFTLRLFSTTRGCRWKIPTGYW